MKKRYWITGGILSVAIGISSLSTIYAVNNNTFTKLEFNDTTYKDYDTFEKELYGVKDASAKTISVEKVMNNFLYEYVDSKYSSEIDSDNFINYWIVNDNIINTHDIEEYKKTLSLNYLIKDLYKEDISKFKTKDLNRDNYYLSYIKYDSKKELNEYKKTINKNNEKDFIRYGFNMKNINEFSPYTEDKDIYLLLKNKKDTNIGESFKFKINNSNYVGVILNKEPIPEDILIERYAVTLFDKDYTLLSTKDTYLTILNSLLKNNDDIKMSDQFKAQFMSSLDSEDFTESFQNKVHTILNKKFSEDWSKVYEK